MTYDSYSPEGPIYEPSKSLNKRIARRLMYLQSRRMVRFNLERPIVSFTFDDCPKSAVKGGINKLDALGWKSTIYIASGLLGTTNHHGLQMSETDVIAAHKAGHEIGGHTFSHIDMSELSLEDVMSDMNKNHQAFRDMGLPPCSTFAYPFGQTTRTIKKHIAPNYLGMRGIDARVMRGKVDLNQIGSIPLFTGKPAEKLIDQINSLTPNSWMTIFTHDITDNPTQWGCTPSEIEAVISAVKNSGADVQTVAGAIETIKASAS